MSETRATALTKSNFLSEKAARLRTIAGQMYDADLLISELGTSDSGIPLDIEKLRSARAVVLNAVREYENRASDIYGRACDEDR